MSELLNAQLRCDERLRELEEASRPAPPREPTSFERKQWADRLGGETRDMRDRRDALASWYASHDDHCKFAIGDEHVTGRHCADRLRLGDDFAKYYRAQGSGEYRGRHQAVLL